MWGSLRTWWGRAACQPSVPKTVSILHNSSNRATSLVGLNAILLPREPPAFLPMVRRWKATAARINEEIVGVKEVRLASVDSSESQLMDLRKALQLAKERGLDLVEIAPTAKPPVVKLLDYKKHVAEQKRKQKEEQRAQGKTKEVKELRFTPKIDKHDMEVKLGKAFRFLEAGHPVQIFIELAGKYYPERTQDSQTVLAKVRAQLAASPAVVVEEGVKASRGKLMFLARPKPA